MLEIDLNIENKSLFTLSEAFTYTISNQKPSSQRKHTFYTNPIHKFKLNPFHFIQNNSMVNLSCYEHETKSQNLICIITSRLLRKHNNLYQKRLETWDSSNICKPKKWRSLPAYEGNYNKKVELKYVSECRKFSYCYVLYHPGYLSCNLQHLN